jgi:hypothetical protein
MLIVDHNDKPITEIVTIQSKRTKTTYTVKSNSKGIAELLLPINDGYVLNLSNYPNFDLIPIPNEPFYQLNYKVEVPQLNHNDCTLKIEVKNTSNECMANEEVLIIDNKTKAKQSSITDEDGKVSFKVPSGNSYTLEYKNAPDYDLINVPKMFNGIYIYKSQFEGSKYKIHPSRLNSLINFYYFDQDSTPLPNERFILTSITTKKQYFGLTDKNGLAQLLVPNGDEYYINTVARKNFYKLVIPSNSVRNIYEHRHYYYSTKHYLLIKDVLERQARKRDSLFKENQRKLAESIANQRVATEKRLLSENYYEVQEEKEIIKERMERKALFTREQLANDSLFFVKTKRAVLSTFFRLMNKWKDKFIVVDFTCSMDPYMDEILLWCQLNLDNNETKNYLFFNDGDNIVNLADKKLGNTGGFHYVFENTLDNIIDTLAVARKLSPECSIDYPENNVEALIAAQKLLKKGAELIMIADNYSPVRDIELIDQVKHPVRIIVCGVEDEINEDLLEIAIKTKGSIHTLEEDFMNISKMKNGDEILINGNVYRYVNGRLFWKRKSQKNDPTQYFSSAYAESSIHQMLLGI